MLCNEGWGGGHIWVRGDGEGHYKVGPTNSKNKCNLGTNQRKRLARGKYLAYGEHMYGPRDRDAAKDTSKKPWPHDHCVHSSQPLTPTLKPVNGLSLTPHNGGFQGRLRRGYG